MNGIHLIDTTPEWQVRLMEQIRRTAISRKVSLTDDELKSLVANLKKNYGLPNQ